jgi:hypothetical protein
MRKMKFNSLPLSTLASALLLATHGGAWAQTPPVPDAGQVLRDLQQARPAAAASPRRCSASMSPPT